MSTAAEDTVTPDRERKDAHISMLDTEPQQVAENIYSIQARFKMFIGVVIPVRMVIIRNPDDDTLTIYSPLNPALYADLSALGTVTSIIAPSPMHSTYAHMALEHYPSATLYSTEGLATRLPDRDWGTLITKDTPTNLLGSHLRVKLVSLGPLKDVVVFHEASQSLLVCDLVFNFSTENSVRDTSWLAYIYIRLTRASAQPLVLNSILRSLTRSHCGDALPDFDEFMEWPFTRVIPNHGDIVDQDAKQSFRDGQYKFVKEQAGRQQQ